MMKMEIFVIFSPMYQMLVLVLALLATPPFQVPYFQIILKNGSVFSSKYRKRDTFSPSQYQFDLPKTADYYFSFDYRGRMSFIYGNSNRTHFFQTFRNIHGKRREKKHEIPGINEEDESLTTGFNCSIIQIGSYLMLFGGGKDRGTKRKAFDVPF